MIGLLWVLAAYVWLCVSAGAGAYGAVQRFATRRDRFAFRCVRHDVPQYGADRATPAEAEADLYRHEWREHRA